LESDVGKCNSLNQAYSSMDTLLCDSLAPPLNGYWFSMLVMVILLLILTIFGWKLLKYYKSYVTYSSPEVRSLL